MKQPCPDCIYFGHHRLSLVLRTSTQCEPRFQFIESAS